MTAENPVPDVDAALTVLQEQDDQADFLRTLARGEVIVPQLESGSSDVQLPFVEEEGTRYVVAFSSRHRLLDSGIEAEDSIALRGSELSAMWPTEAELWLAINPGSDHGVAVSPDTVRALPGMATD